MVPLLEECSWSDELAYSCRVRVLPNKSVIAVKRLQTKSQQGILDDFLNEVVLISGMMHRNLVKLKGCCIREKQRLLVYEYVDNYNLQRVLLGEWMATSYLGLFFFLSWILASSYVTIAFNSQVYVILGVGVWNEQQTPDSDGPQ